MNGPQRRAAELAETRERLAETQRRLRESMHRITDSYRAAEAEWRRHMTDPLRRKCQGRPRLYVSAAVLAPTCDPQQSRS